MGILLVIALLMYGSVFWYQLLKQSIPENRHNLQSIAETYCAFAIINRLLAITEIEMDQFWESTADIDALVEVRPRFV